MSSRSLFISSTFLDMQQERDILSRRVLPILREDLKHSGIDLTEIDLRWGITELMSQDGGAVRLCLEGVVSCMPYLFGMVGNRMGWAPDSTYVDAVQPNLRHTTPDRLGLTGLEIASAINCLKASSAPLPIFLRDDALSMELGFTPDDPTAMAAFHSWMASRKELRLIRYRTLELFEQAAKSELEKLLRTAPVLPKSGSNQKIAIDRSDALQALNRATSRGKSVLLMGPEGAGLSWLAEHWARKGSKAVVHDGRRTALADVLPPSLRKEKGRLASTLKHVSRWVLLKFMRLFSRSGSERCVFDHFEAGFHTTSHASLGVFGEPVPLNQSRLIVTRETRLIAEARQAGWNIVEIQPPNPEQCLKFSQLYLQEFGKHLDRDQCAYLAQAPWLSNIHLNRVVMDELRRFGSHEELTQRLKTLTAIQSPTGVIGEVTNGMRDALPDKWSNALEPMMVALSFSLRGLNEHDCRLMASATLAIPSDTPLPAHLWTPIKIAFGATLNDRSGRVDIGTSQMLSYLSDVARTKPEVWQSATSAFENWLDTTSDYRRAEEAPRYALAAHGLDGLTRILSNPDMVIAILSRGETLLDGWIARLSMADRQRVADSWERHCKDGAFTAAQALALGLIAYDATQKSHGRYLVKAARDERETAHLSKACLAQIDRDVAFLTNLSKQISFSTKTPSHETQMFTLIVMNSHNDGVIDLSAHQSSECLNAAACWAQKVPPDVAAQLWHQSGQMHAGFARWRDADRCFQRAELLTRQSGNGLALTQALERRSAVCLEFNSFRRARRNATEAKKLAQRLGLLREEEKAFHRLIETETRTANLLQAEVLLNELIDRSAHGVGSIETAQNMYEALLQTAIKSKE